MSNYNFTYELPENLQNDFIKMLRVNNEEELAFLISKVKLTYEDVGNAYYAGMRGDNWNKKALDLIIEGREKDIEELKTKTVVIKKKMERLIKPTISGYLIRNIEYLISFNDEAIDLPRSNEIDFSLLAEDIESSISKGEPVLALDRLHTYLTKLIKDICKKNGIAIVSNDGNNYALHSLIGGLTKEYENRGKFKSEFTKTAMKMSISLFEKYNDIRNENSLAHDNELLDKVEAEYVIKTILNLIKFISKIDDVSY